MMRRLAISLSLLALAACGGGPSAPSSPAPSSAPSPGPELQGNGVLVGYQTADAAWAPIVHADGVAGRENAARFFGATLTGDLRIDVFPDRAALTAHWR